MLRRIPSLNWLRVFEAAARTESFTGASQILNMSPSAVSQQIKALEKHLATSLFDRGARTVTLTEAGQSFLPVVRQALLSVETTAASLFGQPREAALEVQSVLIFATSWLAAAAPAFERQNPGVQLHISGDYKDVDALKGQAELRIVFGGVPHSWGESDRLFSETIYPVAVPDIAARIRSVDDLLAFRMIEVATHRSGWLNFLETAGGPDIANATFCYVDTSEISLALAASGYGIALARAPATDGKIAQCGLVRCLAPVELKNTEAYHLVYRNLVSLSPAARRFRAWLLAETENQG